MKLFSKSSILLTAVIMLGTSVYMTSCRKTEENPPVVVVPPVITRGTQKVTLTDPKTLFEKSHSNVNWTCPYLGNLAQLTGRFNIFNFTSFNFDESNVAGINFEGWVYINTVNTGEPGRDFGCLLTTWGVDTTMREQAANKAILKSKSVAFSTTDKSYIVKCDFTFHGVTKEITGKLVYDGTKDTGAGATLKHAYGFHFDYSFMAKSDFLVASTSIDDKVDISCNAIFRQTL